MSQGPLFTASAPAKLNLGLHIVRRRPDGFHDLETVFIRIGWADHLTVRPAEALSLTCSDPALPTDGRNLCLKAAHRLAAYTGITQGAHLHLDKQIPYGAGLGGGSSDAATTLRLLAACWECAVDDTTLHALAAELGSDVPFFLGASAAYATGRGEVLAPMDYTCPFTFVVAMPPVSVSTPEAYAAIIPNEANRSDLRQVVASNDLSRWRAELVNDFEAPIIDRYLEIGKVHRALREAGAGYVAMTGSGAAVFGVFEEPHIARQAAGRMANAGFPVWCGRQAD